MVKSDRAITNGRLMRYLMDLQGYNFSLYYRKGIENQDADAVSRLLRTSDDPNFLDEDELDMESGRTTDEEIKKAMNVSKINDKVRKEYLQQLRKRSKQELKEMAEIMDRILAEGVENLESPGGRKRFLENLKKLNFQTRENEVLETIAETLPRLEKEVAPELTEFVHQLLVHKEGYGEVEEIEGSQTILLPNGPDERRDIYDEYELIPSEQWEGFMVNYFSTRVRQRQDRLNPRRLRQTRKDILRRVQDQGHKTREFIGNIQLECCIRKYKLREKAHIDYGLCEKNQPNLKDKLQPPERHQVSNLMERKRKEGYRQCEVRESLLDKAGNGLYAKKEIKEGSIICSYEGTEITKDQLDNSHWDRDYVASAFMRPGERELKYIDARREDDCYGRFANDPLHDLIVNAKILWRENQMVLIAMVDIEPGDEIYISYSKDYWYSRLERLSPSLQARVRRRYPGEKKIYFREDAEEVNMKYDQVGKRGSTSEPQAGRGEKRIPAKKGMIIKSVATKPPAKNLLTRLKEEKFQITNALEDHEQEEKEVDDQKTWKNEDFAHNNVNQCEELADELRLILEGRKYIDNENGKLYEISRIRYEDEYGMVIGFRKPLHGTRDAEDDFAYAVYGKDGLYELSELYLLEHPEERTELPWPTSRQEWSERQLDDSELREVINQVRESITREVIIDQIRYAFVDTKEEAEEMLIIKCMGKNGWVKRCVIPSKLQKLAMRIHHEGLSHFGKGRMLATLKQNYYWKTMENDVDQHVRNCINCKLRKSYQRRARVPIVHYGKTERILDRVHMDLTGPLRKTKDGHSYILVIKDFLSKYVWLVPLRDKSMEEVAVAFVNDFICQAGIPNMVVSDRGNEFVNKVMKVVARILNIMKVSTTPYNPRADGFVENHNKTLKDQLFHYIDTLKQDDWDVYLPVVQLMYNTTVSLTTGYTPMFLMTGREARLPSNEHMEHRATQARDEQIDNEFAHNLVNLMREVHQEVANKQMKNKELMEMVQRRPLQFKEYEAGQLAFRIRRPVSSFLSGTSLDHLQKRQKEKVSMKLLERYEGPYSIIRKISPVLYDLEIDGKEVRVHATNMKPY